MRSRKTLDNIHFALRLKALYTRLTFNPWRHVVLYIGHEDNTPYNSSQKCFIHLLNSSQEAPKDALCCFTEEGLLPFDEDSVDMILCDLAVLPKTWIEPFLEDAQRVLNAQGKLVLTYNNAFSPYYWWNTQQQNYTHWQVRRLLKKHNMIILKSFFQSFISQRIPRSCRYWIIRWERFLRRFFKTFANKATLLIVKETDFYQPLPAYLRLSKKLATPQTLPSLARAMDEDQEPTRYF